MAKAKKIPIKCKASIAVPLDQLVELQGDLKTLSKEEYEKLRGAILKQGFSFAPHVWKNKGTFYLLDGHQRVRVVRRLVEEEGYEAPQLPVSLVDAKDMHEAKLKLLAAASAYGKGNPDGLAAFLQDSGISTEELSSVLNLDGIDMPDFMEDFFPGIGGDDLGDEKAPPKAPSGSDQVRQLQLFFSTADYDDFVSKVDELASTYRTANITDTLLEVVRAAHKTQKKAA